MIGAIVVSHNALAEGMLSSCDMILGHHEHCKCVCLKEGVDSFEKELYQTLNEMFETYDEIIGLSDMKGGTPFNQLMKYKLENKKDNMYIVSGMNLPLLIELLIRVGNEKDAENLVKDVVFTGQNSVLYETIVETEEDFDDFIE